MDTNAAALPVHEAEFVPQAWIRDYAVDVDPEGPTRWIIDPEFLADLHARYGPNGTANMQSWQTWEDLYSSSDLSDLIKQDPAAPKWVRDWHGPFYVIVTALDEDDE